MSARGSTQDFFHWDPSRRTYVCLCGAMRRNTVGRHSHVMSVHWREAGYPEPVQHDHSVPVREAISQFRRIFP
jgi:hypothetical protein